MPLDNNPKKIPQLTAIPTPTAWNETDIETVVAKESTYANYKMTLAQIYTLATVSGSIKTALDALSALIATNTSSISTLSTTKLNAVGGTRTGLTANKALITDASGNETYLTWASNQVIWFDWAGKPIAVTPTVDIAWLTEKSALAWADLLIISDSQASGVNKKIDVASLFSPFGNWSDGDVTISTNTTLVRDMYYRNLTINSTIVLNPNGYRIYVAGTLTNNGIIRRNGNVWGDWVVVTPWAAWAVLNQWSLNAEVSWSSGAVNSNSTAWTSSNPSYTLINWVSGGWTWPYSPGSGWTSTRWSLYNVIYSTRDIILMMSSPSSYLTNVTSTQYKWPSWSSGGAGWFSSAAGGWAWGNGGVIWIAARIYSWSSGAIEAIGGAWWAWGTNVWNGGGGGWGGQWWVVVLAYETLSSLWTITLTGWTGWAAGGLSSAAGQTWNNWVLIQIPIVL